MARAKSCMALADTRERSTPLEDQTTQPGSTGGPVQINRQEEAKLTKDATGPTQLGPTHKVDVTQQSLEETAKDQTQASDTETCGPTALEQKQEHDWHEAGSCGNSGKHGTEVDKARHRGNSQHKRSDNEKGTTRKRDTTGKTVWNP